MQNSETKPLEDRIIKVQCDGVWKDLPALHPSWTSERAFPSYMPPELTEDGTLLLGARESWMELIELFQHDLRWLLGLDHHIFWSQIVFNKGPIVALLSFLQEAPPAFLHNSLPDNDMERMFKETSRLVFLVICRLSTAKESDEHFISTDFLGNLLYNKYILTVPTLLDICAVYGATNRSMVQTILQKVIQIQPKYLEDLTTAGEYLSQVLEQAKKKQNSTINTYDVTLHVYDSLVTIRQFLDLCPQGQILATPQVLSSISSYYTLVMPNLGKLPEVKDIVDRTRVECLKMVRCILGFEIDQILNKHSQDAVERYLAKVSEIMSEGVFIIDYNAVYPIEVDLDILVSACPDIDTLKIDYLLEALSSHIEIKLKPNPVKQNSRKDGNVIVNYAHSSTVPEKSTSVAVSGVELQSLITEVQDILPHLGSNFVEKCLKYFNYSTERVVAAILESKLPPNIEESDWETEKNPIIENDRKNVFDHDEFDVMDRDQFDVQRVYRGKKPRRHKNVNELLEDKTEILQMKDKFARFSVVEDTLYDDEYDDTYESLDVAAREPDEVDRKRRPFVTPRVLETNDVQDDDDDEEDVGNFEDLQPKSKDAFVENPEIVRERLEQKRRSAGRSFDVVGRAKGQGQDKQVVINREKKSVNKSSRANHNRRDRASRKRNQGMIPS